VCARKDNAILSTISPFLQQQKVQDWPHSHYKPLSSCGGVALVFNLQH